MAEVLAEADLRRIVREECRAAVHEAMSELLLRALGAGPAPEEDPRWSLSAAEMTDLIAAAESVEDVAAIEAAERSRLDGARPGLLAACGVRREELGA